MITHLLLALLPLAAQTPFDEPQWQRIDGVAMHIGDRIISFKELEAAVLGHPKYSPSLSAEQFAELTKAMLEQLANQELEVQAGEDEGFDPERIRQIAQQQTNQRVDELGVASFSDQLRAEGASIGELNQFQADRLYSQLWRSKQMGTDVGFTERVSHDRYIRPGMLKSIFRVSRDMINPATVVLRFFVLSSAALAIEDKDEELAAALDYLADIQRRVASGEDFAQIVRTEASEGRANDGLQPEIAIPAISFDELRAYVSDGPEGGFAPVITLPRQGRTLYLLARLEQRIEQAPVHFGDGELQNRFRRQIRNSVDNRLIESGHERVQRSSHRWMHPDLVRMTTPQRP